MFWSKLCKSNWNCSWKRAFPVFINKSSTVANQILQFTRIKNIQLVLIGSPIPPYTINQSLNKIKGATNSDDLSGHMRFKLSISDWCISILCPWSHLWTFQLGAFTCHMSLIGRSAPIKTCCSISKTLVSSPALLSSSQNFGPDVNGSLDSIGNFVSTEKCRSIFSW